MVRSDAVSPANSDHSAAEGSPALNLQCGNDGGRLALSAGRRQGAVADRVSGPGRWRRYLLHVKFSNDPGTAFEEVTATDHWFFPRTTPGSANVKLAEAYLRSRDVRKGTNDGSMVVWHDDMAICTAAPTLSAG